MALTKRLAFVFAVKGGSTFTQNVHPALMERLASAADTTTGACHYLDHVVRRFSALHLFDQFAGIPQTVGDTDPDRDTVEIDRPTADTFQSSQFSELDFLQRLFSI